MKINKRKMVRKKHNTPGIIKYPFWRMTMQNPRATYACVNLGEAICPKEIERQSICLDSDIGEILQKLVQKEADTHLAGA